MAGKLKLWLKRTPLYWALWRRRAVRATREWTAHDDQMLDFYRRFVNPGDLCFDVGANVGNRSKIFLRLGARVVGVEPQEQCIRVLRSVFAGNKQFTLVASALGAREGSSEMMLSEGTTVSSLCRSG